MTRGEVSIKYAATFYVEADSQAALEAALVRDGRYVVMVV
jgi:hypothetical protein